MQQVKRSAQYLVRSMVNWVDTYSAVPHHELGPDGHILDKADLFRCLPFVLVHLACFAVIWVGWSPVAVGVAVALYLIRMFAITGWYHRYFSHRTFKTPRFWQFVFACVGNSSAQKGPLWWAAHHRHHHRHSDEPVDRHSPIQKGFIWSHIGWITSNASFRTNIELVPDLAKFPELVWLDRFDSVVPFALGVATFLLGLLLEHVAPKLHTGPAQMLIWGFFISTVFTAHATFTINSLAHVFGRRRYETTDTSKNNFLLALLTLGEGWHNNHHHYQSATSQGHRWYEIDITYYILVMMSWVGIVSDLKPVPAHILAGTPAPVRTRPTVVADVVGVPASVPPAPLPIPSPIPVPAMEAAS
jgi:stearoyl-CoA desaturase (delta-9 desaturase)